MKDILRYVSFRSQSIPFLLSQNNFNISILFLLKSWEMKGKDQFLPFVSHYTGYL